LFTPVPGTAVAQANGSARGRLMLTVQE